jgi:hypothetical protein
MWRFSIFGYLILMIRIQKSQQSWSDWAFSLVQKDTSTPASLEFSEDIWKELESRIGFESDSTADIDKEFLHASLSIDRIVLDLRHTLGGENESKEYLRRGKLPYFC